MDAATIKKALSEIADENGRATPELVVQVARAVDHPLHEAFEWDDSAAGEQYRIIQARALMRIHYEVTIDSHKISIPIMLRDPAVESDKQGYRMFDKLARDPSDARVAVAAEFAHAESHLRRARDIATGFGYRPQIEQLLRRILRLGNKIEREPEALSPEQN